MKTRTLAKARAVGAGLCCGRNLRSAVLFPGIGPGIVGQPQKIIGRDVKDLMVRDQIGSRRVDLSALNLRNSLPVGEKQFCQLALRQIAVFPNTAQAFTDQIHVGHPTQNIT